MAHAWQVYRLFTHNKHTQLASGTTTTTSCPLLRITATEASILAYQSSSLHPMTLRLQGGAHHDYDLQEDDHVQAQPPASSYTIVAINVESAQTQFQQIMQLGCIQDNQPDVIILSEHRISTDNQVNMRAKFKQHGWDISMVHAPIQHGRAHGGVAIAVRGGLKFHRHHQDLRQWTEQGRALAGALVTTKGQHVCDILGIYAPTDAAHHPDEVDSILQDVADWVAPRHRIPVVIAGDFNVDVRAHPITTRWLAAGVLIDAVAQHEDQRLPTHVSGTTIDHALVTDSFMNTCVKAATQQEFQFPSHRAIWIDINIQPQQYLSYMNISVLPTTRLARLKVIQLAHQRPTPLEYHHAIAVGDVNKAHRLWCKRWEEMLVEACQFTGEQLEARQIGRSSVQVARTVHPVSRAPKTHYLPLQQRQTMHTVNCLRALVHDELHQEPTWHNRFNWQQRRQRMRSRLRNLHHMDFDPMVELEPERVLALIEPHLRQMQQTHQQEARQRWRQKMEHYGTACKYVNQPEQGHLDRLQLQDGTWTTNQDVIDKELRTFWSDQALDKPETLDDIREATRRLIDDIIPESDYITFEDITATQIQDTIKSLRRSSAPGPGGWHADDLKSLPPLATQELAALYKECERRQHFPTLFSESVTTNIPKGPGKARPQDLRPITVFPMLWRVYAKLRARQATAMLSPRLSPHQFGAIPGISVEDCC